MTEDKPELLENVLKALIEGMAFFTNPRNKATVLKTMMTHLRLRILPLPRTGMRISHAASTVSLTRLSRGWRTCRSS